MPQVSDPPLVVSAVPVGVEGAAAAWDGMAGACDGAAAVVDPLSAALAAVSGGLDAAVGMPLAPLSDGVLLGSVAQLRRLRSRCDAALLRLVGEVDARGAALGGGSSSTAAWLRSGLQMHPGEAKRTALLAAALHEDPPAAPTPPVPLRDTATGQAEPPVDELAVPDAGGTAGDAAEPAGRVGVLAPTRAALRAGVISAEHAAVIEAALRSLPAGLDPGLVSRGEVFLLDQARDADPHQLAALGKHLLHTLDAGKQLADQEQAQVEARELWLIATRGGGYRVKGDLDGELGSALLAALAPYAAPRPAADGARDLRTPGQRNADALADLVRLACSHPDVGTVTGCKPTVVLTLDYATLTRQLGAAAATLDWAGPISAEAARRLACDAKIIPIVLGGDGLPLDVGRSAYTATPAIRRALNVRDGGCAFPGCARPPGWADAHHITHWADGGETKLPNLVLLCGAHHRAVHHDNWTVRITTNGLPEFIPPRWLDRTQTPRAKPWRAQLAALPTTPSADQHPTVQRART